MEIPRLFINRLFISVILLWAGSLEAKAMSKDEIVKIAIQRAKADQHGMFSHPYVESAIEKEGLWTVKLLSKNPTKNHLGAMYMYVIIEAANGKIISVESGGGS